jgi:hypothetical protein
MVEAARSGVVIDHRWPWSVGNGEGATCDGLNAQLDDPFLLGVC